MYGIPIEAGKNDCEHNREGKCICPSIWFNEGKDRYSSDVNCPMTQCGVTLCSEYSQAGMQ